MIKETDHKSKVFKNDLFDLFEQEGIKIFHFL